MRPTSIASTCTVFLVGTGLPAHLRALGIRMATENPTWRYTRIQGALKNLGHRVGRSTIARILRVAGIPPGRQRPMTWRTFLQAHWPALVAADFFTTEVWTARGLVTLLHRVRPRSPLSTRAGDRLHGVP